MEILLEDDCELVEIELELDDNELVLIELLELDCELVEMLELLDD